ncbi:unnamed protein product [Calicophoron daubneyi]|uniref:dolichol kinase n=1 Tax=Calicophoron daubneyi TaxID=300641 RepID=A0AAV2TSR8_CALDB
MKTESGFLRGSRSPIRFRRVYISLLSKCRRGARPGLWMGFIVPLLLLRTQHQEIGLDILTSTLLLFLSLFDLGVLNTAALGIYASSVVVCFSESGPSLRPLLTFGFMTSATHNFLHLFPSSFTLGEALLLSHLSIVFIVSSPLFPVAFVLFFLIERYALPCTFLVFSAVLTVFTSSLFFLFRNFPKFSLHCRLGLRQLSCFSSSADFLLLSFWAALLFGCLVVTWVYRQTGCLSVNTLNEDHGEQDRSDYALGNHESPQSTDVINNNHQSALNESNSSPLLNLGDPSGKISERNLSKPGSTPSWLRKFYHFAAGVVYTSGIMFSPRLLIVCSVSLLVSFTLFEWMRRRGKESVAQYLNGVVQPFRDERDGGTLVFTPIALLLGLSIPIWWPSPPSDASTLNIEDICGSPKLSPHVWSGVLSIAVGDSVAALIGRAWGRLRWPGSHRTLLGSLASWFSQVAFWSVITRLQEWPFFEALIPITVGVVVEAYTDQIDNIVVPLIVMMAFHL